MRRTRCSVSFSKEMSVPDVEVNVKEKIIQRRTESKFYHDREAKVLTDLAIGEPVYVELQSPDDKYTKSVID
jgi:hypothetical protein